MIRKTNLNLQDNNGKSPFYIISKLNLWEKLFDILKKKLNAFQKVRMIIIYLI